MKDIMDLTGVTDVKFLDKTNSVNTDLKKLQLCLITELSMKQKFIWDGTILSSYSFSQPEALIVMGRTLMNVSSLTIVGKLQKE